MYPYANIIDLCISKSVGMQYVSIINIQGFEIKFSFLYRQYYDNIDYSNRTFVPLHSKYYNLI